FGALPSGTAGTFETELARRGTAVFSNSADHRMDRGVPLLVPEVNPDHLSVIRTTRKPAPIITNPNCTATGLVLGLAPILPLLRPRWISVATYQALSGAGYPGIASLSVTDNVVPYIAEEEEKVSTEAKHILGSVRENTIDPAPLELLVQCARVGVRDGHLEAVTLRASRRPSRTALASAIRGFDPLRGLDLPMAPHPPVQLRSEVDRPQPLRDRWAGNPPRARGMTVSIGRLRWEPPYLRCFVLSHNAVRGGAGASVLNAEFAISKGYVEGRRGGADA
ncbi:MAG: aspartate-semialdehyde dehydrogenase, partial [Thermoplasmata archaeon]